MTSFEDAKLNAQLKGLKKYFVDEGHKISGFTIISQSFPKEPEKKQDNN